MDKKRIVIFDEWTGGEDCIKASAEPEWDCHVIPAMGSPHKLKFSQKKVFGEIAAQMKNCDLFMFIDSLFLNATEDQVLAACGEKLYDEKTFCSRKAHRRLESDRVYGKTVDDKVGIPTPAWDQFYLDDRHAVLTKFAEKYPKFAVKMNADRFFGLGTLTEMLSALDRHKENLVRNKSKWFADKNPLFIVEEFIPDEGIEMAVSMLANGKTVSPMCTVFDGENRIFPDGMGPKFSDAGNIIIPGVADRFMDEVVKPISKWSKEVGYVGGLDVDFKLMPDGRILCFEHMTRYSIPTSSTIFKTAGCNWAEVFYRMKQGKKITQDDFKWTGKVGFGMALLSFSVYFNNLAGPVPTGEAVQGNWRDYYMKKPTESDKHLVGLEMFYDQKTDEYKLAGAYGRHMMAIGVANHWKKAKKKAYKVANDIHYTNKHHRVDLFKNKVHDFDEQLEMLLKHKAIAHDVR